MLQDSYANQPSELDQLVFDKIVPQDHYLRQVKTLIDFDFIRSLVQDCYSPAMGRPAEDPVRLFKLEFLQLHYNLSDREVLRQAQVNVAFRYFLDLSMEGTLPSHGLLSQFRSRLGLERYQAIFQQVLAQARRHGLVKDRLRLKDATHVIADIAVPSTLALVAQIRVRLLDGTRVYAPEQVAQEAAKARQIRQATLDLSDQERLLQRVRHLQRIVDWADELREHLGAIAPDDAVRIRFEQALALAHKVLSDQHVDRQGDKLRSGVDPDARRGKHGAYFDGYLLDVSLDAESELITALAVLPANGPEAANAAVLLQAETEAHGNQVEAVSLDGIGWQGRVLRQLEQQCSVAVYVPPPPEPAPTGLFTTEAFTLAQGVLRCPAGEETTKRYRNVRDTAWQYEFKRSQCTVCRLLSSCMQRLPGNNGRRVNKNDYQQEYDVARARAQSRAYEAVRRVHWRIERKLAEMVRYHGGRRTRYRGRWRAAIQYVLTGIVVNVKRMVRLLGGAANSVGIERAVPLPPPLVAGFFMPAFRSCWGARSEAGRLCTAI